MFNRQSLIAVFVAVAFVATGLGVAGACGLGGDEEDGEITVFAASSLTEAFTELGKAFEASHPGAKVTFNFAASSALAVQINEGAPFDVFASADLTQMQSASRGGRIEESLAFTYNELVVVATRESGITAFSDLAKPGTAVVLAGAEVPVGRYAREALLLASRPGGVSPDFSDRVLQNVRSEEANVRAVLTKVQLGEADAGIVYRTDAQTVSSDLVTIEIASNMNVVAEYPIGYASGDKQPVALAFVQFARSEQGQAILERHGFRKAPNPLQP